MTLETAISLLGLSTAKNIISKIENENEPNGKAAAVDALNEAAKIACCAMRKRIAKIAVIYDYHDRNGKTEMDVRCPDCGNMTTVISEDTEKFYCGKCGQLLEI